MTASRPPNPDQPEPRRRAGARASRPVSRALEALLAQAVTVDDAGEPVSRAEQIAARLIELAADPDPSISLRAINMLMERLEGRPAPNDGLVDRDEVNKSFDRAIQMFYNFVPEDRHEDLLAAMDRVLAGTEPSSAPA